ncbi:unnamed protein product [Linum trigynum]|uniref:Uncharacterized protein n=1 Tax=Linum trigynum TaxID=586398 RepID=A0AAV2D0X2_9ROSI
MNPVERITPTEKAFTRKNTFLFGCKLDHNLFLGEYGEAHSDCSRQYNRRDCYQLVLEGRRTVAVRIVSLALSRLLPAIVEEEGERRTSHSVD